MCKKRNSVLWRGKRVDSCMRNGLNRFFHYGIVTLASCCGHGIYTETVIILNENREIIEYGTQKKIPRKKRFYRKDSKGFYFIPELEGEKHE